ncbi:serine/threonine protein kinase [Clostridium amylolyticum]|uniref:non-specific serine/threonine protein kinase n=1 Tax=Clostridium amylolyticum TaxID=1121298 RepID=A0A1M6J6F5_9CLOT|nr:serine/threonine-protein kinase [Clostridium amylolyticum]SHJ42251.1 serine/threonine protein kinase [Clostridium amylolyticum]
MNLIGTLFENRYQIIDILGKGGMSTVYLAKDTNLQKFWAIKKVLKSSKNLKADLMAEANILKRLDHPALPRIVDIIEKEDSIYVILDFIDGISLDKKLVEFGVVDEFTIINWALQICDVLNYLHSQKPNPIIYRDMKPGNIMLTAQGKIKLIDFGIAREYKEEVSQDTTYIGTKGYAAPEQYGSHQTDERTDIYSLGVTLYHLATGKGPSDPPYEIKPVREINPLLSEGFEIIINKCTEQDPNLRYQSIEELIYDIENIHKLNSSYKKTVRKKFIKLSATLLSFVFFAILTGFGGYKVNNINQRIYNSTIENAEVLTKSNSMDEAKKIFRQAIELNPEDPSAYKSAIDMFLKNNDYDGCIEFISPLVQKNASKNYEVLYWFGKVYFLKGDYYQANKRFESIKSTKKLSNEAKRELLYYKPIAEELGSTTSEKNKSSIQTSINLLREYIDTIPNSQGDAKINSYIALANIYQNNADVFPDTYLEDALTVLKEASKFAPDNNIVLLEMLGTIHYKKALRLENKKNEYDKELNEAAGYFEKALKAGSNVSNTYYLIGTIYKYLEKYDDSIRIFNEHINKFEKDYKGNTSLGVLYADLIIKDRNNLKEPDAEYYIKIAQCYDNATKKNPNTNDPDYKKLKNMYESLKSEGKIK